MFLQEMPRVQPKLKAQIGVKQLSYVRNRRHKTGTV